MRFSIRDTGDGATIYMTGRNSFFLTYVCDRIWRARRLKNDVFKSSRCRISKRCVIFFAWFNCCIRIWARLNQTSSVLTFFDTKSFLTQLHYCAVFGLVQFQHQFLSVQIQHTKRKVCPFCVSIKRAKPFTCFTIFYLTNHASNLFSLEFKYRNLKT